MTAPRKEEAREGLLRRYGIGRIFKFAVASALGFLVYETVLVLGIFVLYHVLSVPSSIYSSLNILGLDVLALATGNTVAFVINERVTVVAQGAGPRKGLSGWFTRWSKYQLASLMGSIIIVGVQLALFATFALSPVLGSVIGAIVSYPVTYAVSMHFVWGVKPFGEQTPSFPNTSIDIRPLI